MSMLLSFFCERAAIGSSPIKGASIQTAATKAAYSHYPAPVFRQSYQYCNKSQVQGNYPIKLIDILENSLYNSSVLTYFILIVKNGGEDNEVFY